MFFFIAIVQGGGVEDGGTGWSRGPGDVGGEGLGRADVPIMLGRERERIERVEERKGDEDKRKKKLKKKRTREKRGR